MLPVGNNTVLVCIPVCAIILYCNRGLHEMCMYLCFNLPNIVYALVYMYTTMFHFCIGTEVKMKDSGTSVISYQDLNTVVNPVEFAGTHWYSLATTQYLYAAGPIDQAVEITVCINTKQNILS